jgi:hypothetical protein
MRVLSCGRFDTDGSVDNTVAVSPMPKRELACNSDQRSAKIMIG